MSKATPNRFAGRQQILGEHMLLGFVCKKTAKPKRVYAFELFGLRFSWLAPRRS
jgi:hypothetical protein